MGPSTGVSGNRQCVIRGSRVVQNHQETTYSVCYDSGLSASVSNLEVNQFAKCRNNGLSTTRNCVMVERGDLESSKLNLLGPGKSGVKNT